MCHPCAQKPKKKSGHAVQKKATWTHDLRLFPANISLVHIGGDKGEDEAYGVAAAPPTSIFSVRTMRGVAAVASDALVATQAQ